MSLLKAIAVIAATLAVSAASYSEAAQEYHFDFGPPDSPVAEGYAGLDAATAYSPQRGYGWSSGTPENYVTQKPEVDRPKWWHTDPAFFYHEITNDFRTDGVQSAEPFAFKIDLPAGKYRVDVTVGHLTEPRYSIDVYANGELIRKAVDARLWLFRGLTSKASGYYKRVRFSVNAANGGLTLEFKGDDAEYRRLMEIEVNKTPDERPQNTVIHAPLDAEYAPFQDIGGPFGKISLMGLQIYPEREMPIEFNPETLNLDLAESASSDGAILEAVKAFNSGKFKDAEAAFLKVSDPLSRGIGLMALAGRPEYENELANMEAAVAALKEAVASGANDGNVLDLLESAEIFYNGLCDFRDRGIPVSIGEVAVWRAVAEFDQIQPDDSLYYKAQTLQGRFMIMLDAHQWCWCSQEGKKKLRFVEERFPDNRYVQFYLHGKTADSPDWASEDYLARAKGAPEWAAGLYAGYNLLVDISEWWALNKQQADGSIGGGWGDDVELVGLFGYIARVSEGSSPLSIQLARNLMNGVYASGHMDEVGGFFCQVGDSEHVGEWTGKTLPMMLTVDYGNPLWFERSLQTAKLMKEIWMGVNSRGHLHWRSYHMGASGVGTGMTQLDNSMNWRCANPAVAILYFTGNPAIKDMVLRHADALYEDAMRTDKGKPKGIIPGEIDFETGEIGGRDVPTWYDPGDIPGKDWYRFENYHYQRTRVMRLAYQLSGDEKYLEPIKAEADYAKKHGGDFSEKLHKLEPGSPQWVATVLEPAIELMELIDYEKARKAGQDIHKADVKDIVENTIPYIPKIRADIPRATTEALATDRVGIPNCLQILRLLMGWIPSDPIPQLTYRHVGKDFAAAVLGADSTSVTAMAYVFGFNGEKTKTMGFVPWKLDLGAEYTLAWGLDSDENGEMDSEEGRRDFTLTQRGESIDIELQTGKTYLVKFTQTKPTPFDPLLPDLAVGPADVEYHKEWELLFVTVHNIGAADAAEYEVVVTEKETGEQMRAIGSCLDAPLDFTPKRTRFGFQFVPSRKSHQFDVAVRSLKGQPELTGVNNTLTANMEFGE
jgi:hypothetical protein